MLENKKINLYIHSSISFHFFIFLVIVIGVIIFNILTVY
jgi:hypothetical protein